MRRVIHKSRWAITLAACFGFAGLAQAQGDAAAIDSGDTAWMMMSSALVLLMTPGLAFFYGGLVRRKNILSVLMQCFLCMCLMTILWVVVGYSLAFGGNSLGGFIGNFDHVLLKGRGIWPGHAGYGTRYGLHGIPVHVRDHHAGPDYRGVCGAHEIQRVLPVQRVMAPGGLLPGLSTGSGAGLKVSSAWEMTGHSISPVVQWCTSMQGSQPS